MIGLAGKLMFDPKQAVLDLQSTDASVRLAAAKAMSREALKESSSQGKRWLGTKTVTTALLAALDDPDPKVAQNAVVAIAEITRRYWNDGRAYPGVVRLLASKEQATRFWAVAAAINLRGEDSFDDVLPLAGDMVRNVRLAVLRGICAVPMDLRLNGRGTLGPANRERLQELALGVLEEANLAVRSAACTVLREVGDARALARLDRALQQKRNRSIKDIVAMAVEYINRRS